MLPTGTPKVFLVCGTGGPNLVTGLTLVPNMVFVLGLVSGFAFKKAALNALRVKPVPFKANPAPPPKNILASSAKDVGSSSHLLER